MFTLRYSGNPFGEFKSINEARKKLEECGWKKTYHTNGEWYMKIIGVPFQGQIFGHAELLEIKELMRKPQDFSTIEVAVHANEERIRKFSDFLANNQTPGAFLASMGLEYYVR